MLLFLRKAFFTPGALVAMRALEVSCESHVHCHQRLGVGGNKFVPAVLTLVGSHADLQLEGVKAGDQEDYAKPDHRHQLPDPLGNQECRQKDSCH